MFRDNSGELAHSLRGSRLRLPSSSTFLKAVSVFGPMQEAAARRRPRAGLFSDRLFYRLGNFNCLSAEGFSERFADLLGFSFEDRSDGLQRFRGSSHGSLFILTYFRTSYLIKRLWRNVLVHRIADLLQSSRSIIKPLHRLPRFESTTFGKRPVRAEPNAFPSF